ncbi:hypothetical protein MTR67_048023 [Solanum verrucosum]|uniref:THO complex subunit 2 N-terminal domain-containing protein n=1 Tax=Solanum verrucosum TaxID=315347 RepID=A0AAF0UX79_SOLVR|nr:hypothetical protein MTR67_048023 [Solanum verrucosum]
MVSTQYMLPSTEPYLCFSLFYFCGVQRVYQRLRLALNSSQFPPPQGLQQQQFSEECWKQRMCCMKRTRTQTRVKEEQLLSTVNEEEREESFEDSENSGAIVEEPVVSETTNRPMGLQQHQFTEDEPVVSQTAIVVWAYSNSNSRRSVGNSECVVWFWSVLNVSLSHASQILGFKFQYYQCLEVNDPVPSELYQLTALLVKRDFIYVDSIYAHLLPKEDAAFDHYNAFLAKRLDEANKIGRIIVAATGKDLMDEEKQGDVTVDLYAAFDMETDAVAERSSELENSQPLGLLMGFLEVDDWGKVFVASSPWRTKLTVLEKELLASHYCLRKDQALGGTL